MVSIQNITYCVNLNCELDLDFIARNSINVEYNKNRFNALVMRLRKKPRSTCLIFRNGKLVLTGCKSVLQCLDDSRKIARIIQKLGYDVKISNGRVENMVGSFDCGIDLDLTSLASKIGSKASFEPELFPGLIYTFHNKCKATLFRSGKINITGAKCEEVLNDAFDNIFTYLFYLEPNTNCN
jgi:transcription initiation factor TFIID TATA-box-binding protein